MSIFYTGNPLNKLTKVVPIFYTINNAYAPYAAASINSLMQHTDPNRYYRIIILHDGLDLPTRIRLRSLVTNNCAIQFKKISNNLYLKIIVRYCLKAKGSGDYFAKAVYYYRAFIARLFTEYNKAVYVDSDTIFRADVGELYDMDLEGKSIAGMVDTKILETPEFQDYVVHALGLPYTEYVNSGVLVMDLKKLRKVKYLSQMIEMIKVFDADLLAPDQDYLNVILEGDIAHFSNKWNSVPLNPLPKNTKLVHFNLTYKPWHHRGIACEKLFWNAARGTGFYGDLKRQLDSFSAEDQKAEDDKLSGMLARATKLAKTKKPLIKKIEK